MRVIRHILSISAVSLSLLASLAGLATVTAHAADRPFTIIGTGALEPSGLLEHLMARYPDADRIDMRYRVTTADDAVALAERNGADVLIIDVPDAAARLVRDGHAVLHEPLMQTDYVVVGPASVQLEADTGNPFDVLSEIRERKLPVLSWHRSGSAQQRETELWRRLGLDSANLDQAWYRRSTGSADAFLRDLADKGAFSVIERALWLTADDRETLEIKASDSTLLATQYSVIVVEGDGQYRDASFAFANWLMSTDGLTTIETFMLDGQSPYEPVDANLDKSLAN